MRRSSVLRKAAAAATTEDDSLPDTASGKKPPSASSGTRTARGIGSRQGSTSSLQGRRSSQVSRETSHSRVSSAKKLQQQQQPQQEEEQPALDEVPPDDRLPDIITPQLQFDFEQPVQRVYEYLTEAQIVEFKETFALFDRSQTIASVAQLSKSKSCNGIWCSDRHSTAAQTKDLHKSENP